MVLAAAIAFAGYEIGHGSSSPGSIPTPTATPTVVPTSAPPATTTAATSPTAAASATAGPSPTATSPGSNPRVADPPVIRNNGYTPGIWAWTSDGHGGRLYAWAATCSNSGDGYCQKVFFYDNTTWLGTDTRQPSRQIVNVAGEGTATPEIAVKYANYKASDALCCPSGKPVTIIYTLNGSSLTPNGTPPGQ